MSFGQTPLSTTSLGTNEFPVSAVAVPNEAGGNLTALEGGPESTDTNGNKTAPVSMYVKDGGNVTQGTSTDANTVNSIMGRLTKIRDLLNATLTVGGTITEANSAAIKADLDAINTSIGAISDAAWSGSGSGSEIAILKKIVAELAATLTVSGTVTANAGTGTFTNQQSNVTTDYDTGAGTQNLTIFGVALPASGGAVSGGTSTNPIRTDPTGTTTQPVNGTVTVQQATAANLKVDLSGTAANSTAIKTDGSGVTQPVSGTVTANIGTTNGVALDTSVNGVIVAQGSTTSGEKGPLVQGAVTTSAPTYTTAQTSPISLTTAGAVRVDNSATTQPVSGTVTANAGTGSFTVAQTTGSNLHAVLDAGSAVIGHVINDASSAVIGHIIADSGSTTAVTQATASNLNAQVVGSVASGASNAGNPVKDGGVFNTTQPTVTTGQVVDAQYSARGAAIVATGVDAFAVSASQSGTWNVTNVSGTVSLPTGASTSAKQPALGTAGSASADVITVQGVASMTAIKTDGSGVTQPVSGTVTANAGSGTFNIQGNASVNVNQVAGSSVATAATGIMKVGVTDASGNALNSTSNALNVSQQASGSSSTTLQTAQTGNANGTSLTVLGMASVAFTVTVSGFTGTVNFEGTEDNSNWSSLLCTLAGGTTTATSASGAGQYSASCAGLQSVRARTSGVSAGNVTVTAHAVPVSGGGGGGGGSGSNASVSATASSVPSSASYIGGNKAGNLVGVSLDGSGNLNVNVAAGGGSGGTSSSFGSALPATGTAIGFTDGTNMQAGKAFDADTGAGTEYVVGAILRKSASGGSVEAGTSSNPLRTDPTGTTTQPVSGTVSITANSAVNVAQVAGTTTDTNSGNKSAGTQRFVLATDQPQLTNALKVDGSGVTQPVSGTVTANAGTGTFTNQQSNVTADYDSGAGTQNLTMFGVALPASGGSVAGGTSTNPIRTDTTGTTTQPVSGTVSITANSSVNVAQVAGTTTDTNSGNKSAGTQRIVLATDQPQLTNALKVDGSGVTQPVSGTVTANAGTGTFTNQQSNITTDYDTGAGTQTMTMFGLALPASGGSVAGGTATNPVQVSLANTAANSTAVKVDGSAVTQPVSGTVSITANSAVNVAQVGGTNSDTNSGNKSAGTLRVVLATDQPALTNKLLVTPDSVALPANQSVNVSQINGVTATMGNGVSGTGVQRVTIASDSTGQVTLATGANTIGALTANQSVNVAQVAGATTSTAASGVQKVGVVGNSGATVDSTIGAGTAPTNAVVTGSVYNSSAPAPTSGQAMALQADQAGNSRIFPGIALATLSAWNSSTSLNATQTIFTNSGAEAVLVQLTQTTTLTAGAVTFEVTYDGSNWSTIPASAVLDPTSTTFAQISLPYTVQASTNKTFLLNMNGAQGLRAKLSTQITGTGTVTPNYALLPASPADTVVALSPTAANFNVTASAGTNLNTSALALESGGNLATLAGGVASSKYQTNVAQLAGTTTDTNSGNKSAGTLRVVLATDQPALTNAQPTNVTQVSGASIATGNNALPVLTSAATGYVSAFGSNAAALTSSTDYAFKWGAGGTTQVNHLMIQNNTTANVNFDLDTTSNAGSPILAPGQTLFLDVQTTAVHLFQAGTPNVNGSSAGNIVVRGWL